MDIGCYNGAMYARLEDGEELDIDPLELGDSVINTGEYISKLGEKKRTSFEMQDGWYLRYLGKYNDTLLFGVNTRGPDDPYSWCYAFVYVDSNTLLVGSGTGMRDIRINKLDKFVGVKLQETTEQISLF